MVIIILIKVLRFVISLVNLYQLLSLPVVYHHAISERDLSTRFLICESCAPLIALQARVSDILSLGEFSKFADVVYRELFDHSLFHAEAQDVVVRDKVHRTLH